MPNTRDSTRFTLPSSMDAAARATAPGLPRRRSPYSRQRLHRLDVQRKLTAMRGDEHLRASRKFRARA